MKKLYKVLPLNCDRDPVRWADEFLKVVEVRRNSEEVLTGKEPLLDKGWLIGWFANAMMCGEDTYRWRLPRYSLSYMTPKGTRVHLFNLSESAVREIETVQKTLGSSDFRIEEQETPIDREWWKTQGIDACLDRMVIINERRQELERELQQARSASEDMKLKRAAYVLGMALLQSSLPLDSETIAARDYAVSLGEDRRVMFPTDSRGKE